MKKDKPIIALDFPNAKEANQFLNQLGSADVNIKIGMELYYAEGAPFVNKLVSKGYNIFLDLKLHDIPNTVYSAIKVISQLGVSMINVHALGGQKMMKAAKKAIQESERKPLLIAVTQLTSTEHEQFQKEQLSEKALSESVVYLAKLAKEAGLDGVVCSPHEVEVIKKVCGRDFLTVTPGIRLESITQDDQVRIMTPRQAKEIGSDYIVVGRPITRAEHVSEAYAYIEKEWSGE